MLQRMLDQDFLTRAQYDDDAHEADARPGRPAAADRGRRLPVLHLVDQAAGRRPARRRPGGRPAGVRGRPDDHDHDRRRAPAGGRGRDQQLAAQPRRPARRARGDREQDRARSARWSAATPTTSCRSTSRPRASASRARRSSRSSSPRRCSQGISPNSVWASKKLTIDVPHSKEIFTVNNYEGAYSGITHARARDDVLRQLRVRPGRHQGRHAQGRPPGGAHGHPHERLAQLRDDARRPEGGRDPARHGARVRDVRQRRRPGLRHAQPRRRQPARRHGARPGRHRADRRTGRRQGQADRAAERRARRSTASASATCSTRAVAEQVSSLLQGVVRSAPARAPRSADTVVAGKTGTTEGYGDAWFVGWTPEYTVAVWVGYPNEFKSMETEYQGQPVAGGTFPAGIFQTFIEADLRNNPPKEDEAPRTPAAPLDGGTTPPPAPTRRRRRRDDTGGAAAPPSGARAGADRAAPPVPTTPPAATPAPGGDEAPDAGATGAAVTQSPAATGRETLREPGDAEAPRQLDRLGDPDPRSRRPARRPPSPAAAPRSRPARRRGRCRCARARCRAPG